MINIDNISEVMGGKKLFNSRISSMLELHERIEKGLPKIVLKNIYAHITDSPSEALKMIYQLIPEATYKRRQTLLKPEESERAERVARVIATAEYVWDDKIAARTFLTTPHGALSGKKPIDLARSELGARHIEEMLWQIYYGLPQ